MGETMEVAFIRSPLDYIQIDNTYTEEELKLIFLELDFLQIGGTIKDQDHFATAKYENGEHLRKGMGVFLDNVYRNRESSIILKLNRKLYGIDFKNFNLHPVFKAIKKSTLDNTLVSYYENSHHYEAHYDASVLTAFTYLYKQPKKFEGGELFLPEYNVTFNPVFNRTYVIPGLVDHEVKEVKMNSEDLNKGFGRYCISNFLNFAQENADGNRNS